MNFQPELAAQVMAGEKTVTRRLVSDNPRSPWFEGGCSLQVGRDYAVCPGRGKNAIGRVRIIRATLEPLALLNYDQEARREGFDDVEAFEAAWRSINGAYDPESLVWRIEFEVVERAGASVGVVRT